MKEMNRREFLTLTGAAVVALSLAGCGGGTYAPPAPAVPTTGEEANVLEAIKKYRAAAGVEKPLALDNGLKDAVEIVAEVAKGDKKYKDVIGDLSEIMKLYPDLSAPIGVRMENDDEHMNVTPVCIYLEDVEKMALNLPSQVDDTAKEALKSARLIAIQLFEYGGAKYWVAVVSKGKVTP